MFSFDGNHRVAKDIDHSVGTRRRRRNNGNSGGSNSSRRRGTVSSTLVSGLQNEREKTFAIAQSLREQRRLERLEIDSAGKIQRWFRAWSCCRAVSNELRNGSFELPDNWSLDSSEESADISSSRDLTALNTIAGVSLLLSPYIICHLDQKKKGKGLMEVLVSLHEARHSDVDTCTVVNTKSNVHETFSFGRKRIALKCLEILKISHFTYQDDMESFSWALDIVNLLSRLMVHKFSGDLTLHFQMSLTLRLNEWLNCLFQLSSTTQPSQQQKQQHIVQMASQIVYKLTHLTTHTKYLTHGALSASLLCNNIFDLLEESTCCTFISKSWRHDMLTCLEQIFTNQHDMSNTKSWQIFLIKNISFVLNPSENQGIFNGKEKSNVSNMIRDIIHRKEVTLLTNVFHLCEQLLNEDEHILCTEMTRILRYVLSLPGDGNVIFSLAALVASGEVLDSSIMTKSNNIIDITNKNMEDSDQEDDEREESHSLNNNTSPHNPTPMLPHIQNSLSAKKKNGPLQRSDLQTVPKLNRLFSTHISMICRDALNSLRLTRNDHLTGSLNDNKKKAMITLAKKVGEGPLLLSLGKIILLPLQEINYHDCNDYISLIFHLTIRCSTTKARDAATSPLLSKLAFYPGLLESIWKHIQSYLHNKRAIRNAQSIYSYMTVFCDLFAHRLLAVDDDEFLANYSKQHQQIFMDEGMNYKFKPNVDDLKRIYAVDVVSELRDMLYDLYWANPVLMDDFLFNESEASPASKHSKPYFLPIERYTRVRLMLSGSKLWNSLYERWCRLTVRSDVKTFCEESNWWFSHVMASVKDDDAAVINPSNDDDQDIMQEDSADEMEVDGGAPTNHLSPTTADDENDAMASSFRDPKMARVLTSIPQAVPFDRRARLFTSLLEADKATSQDEASIIASTIQNMQDFDNITSMGDILTRTGARHLLKIRRDNLYDDAMEGMNNMVGKHLRRKVQVTFINQHGAVEAGIDGGGVFREFLDDLIHVAFHYPKDEGDGPIIQQDTHEGCVNNYLEDFQNETSNHSSDQMQYSPKNFFVPCDTQTLKVNTAASLSALVPNLPTHYEFLGRILGKAVYESHLVETQFCIPFLNRLLGKHNTLDDLRGVDEELHKNLCRLQHLSSEDLKMTGLTFEVVCDGKTKELLKNGSKIPVLKENVVKYVHLYSNHRLNIEGAERTRSFLKGFHDLIPPAWVRLFSANEVQKLIGGDDSVNGIDVTGLKKVMQYSGGYHPSQPIMQWFWQVLEEMNSDQQHKFLKFMTSCSRQPLLGFKALVPVPCIQQVPSREQGGSGLKLPTSSTCANLLKLPCYESKEILRSKLIYAIESGAGFELT